MGKPSAECAGGFLLEFALYKVGGGFVHSRKLEGDIFCGARMRGDVGIEPYGWFAILFISMKMGRLVGGRTRNARPYDSTI